MGTEERGGVKFRKVCDIFTRSGGVRQGINRNREQQGIQHTTAYSTQDTEFEDSLDYIETLRGKTA